jgi:S1-C subfamily serine protease
VPTFAKYPVIAIAALLLAACATNDVSVERRDISFETDSTPVSGPVDSDAMRPLVARTAPTYVTLTVSSVSDPNLGNDKNTKTPVTSGSGFIVDGSGYVMTAAHVAVSKGNVVSARAADGRLYSGKVVNVLPGNDLALIKLKAFHGPAVMPLAQHCMNEGTPLFSLGRPHDLGDTARLGTLESMSFGRAVQYGKFGYPDAMVMRMRTQRGESGGPVFTNSGELAGMVVSTLSDSNGQLINLAHAIPVNDLAGFLCSNMNCGPKWQSLATSAHRQCV